ncbi:MAG: ABC transporter permease, partial [Ruminiclostridium sp.]|nr:ABC transporter permease [Ruminiclostridium sp.]
MENSKTVIYDDLLFLVHGESASGTNSTRLRINAMSGLEDHIDIVQGEMYSKSGIAEDGSYQVIVTEEAAKTLGIVCGNKYLINPVNTSQESFYITVTGFFVQSDMNDSYWSEDLLNYIGSVFIPYDLSEKLINDGLLNIINISINYNLNYHSVNMNDISNISKNLNSDFDYYAEMQYKFEMGSAGIISGYVEKASSLTAILWAIQIPTMIMLAFYLFMVSQLNIEREKNEISVLKSRGAKSFQIFSLYSMEMGLLGLITLLIAPFIGLLLCRFLGVSNGFMEFVNRTGIAAKLSVTAFIYALAAVLVFFVTTMIPIIPASKLTIVEYKQSKTKVRKTALWELCGIDIILIGLSVTFYFLYTNFTNEAISEGTFEATGQIDPLIFVFSSCLILGLGLFFVRIYPYVLKLIYKAGRLLWTPAQYMALTSVSCAGGSKERFLMLFLILTFSYGIFSANTARAINNNKSDMIYYQNGADIVITEYWPETEYSSGDSTEKAYKEPDFSRYKELTGVESVAKVLYDDNAKLYSGGKNGETVKAMAVEPISFAKT